VVDMPFDETDPVHVRLVNLEFRAGIERDLADDLGLRDDKGMLSVVLDVPEQIGFEIRFPVMTASGLVDYPEAGTVFTPVVIGDFTRTLRRIRLMLSPEAAESAGDIQARLTALFNHARERP